MKRPKTCTVCGRQVNNSFICRRCGRELREALVGDGTSKAVVQQQHNRGQPGIMWYLDRLRETAYRQAKIERSLGARTSSSGYALLGDKHAIALIDQILRTVERWNDDLDRLIRRQAGEKPVDDQVLSESALIRRLANNIPLLRHNAPDIDQLLHNLLTYAKDAWKIINRPDDICCGPCPNVYRDRETGEDVECGRMLYAEEYEADDGKRIAAETVRCPNPKCRKKHNVQDLRDLLKQRARDKLFTGPELLALMENRLNDRMSKSTFYQLVRDGRLLPSGFNENREPMYTYALVCEAREKPKPKAKVKRQVAQ